MHGESVIRRPRPDNRQRFSGPRINDRIRIPEIRVIGAEGEMLGVMDTADAKRLAREKELDLVEVNPKAHPPVCKIMDYGKYKYEEKKKQSEARRRQSQIAIKEVKLRPKTDDHDVDVRIKRTRKFLEDGNKVKITVRFRGREITHPETAERQIEVILDAVRDLGLVEQHARMEGRTMTCMIAPRQKNVEVRRPRRSEPGGEEGAESPSP